MFPFNLWIHRSLLEKFELLNLLGNHCLSEKLRKDIWGRPRNIISDFLLNTHRGILSSQVTFQRLQSFL